MNRLENSQFLELYERFRYEDQINFYESRHHEFAGAQAQAITVSIVLIFLAALTGALELIDVPWLKVTCLLAAAICPVLSTALAAYNALYAFEQQAKLYHDTIRNLLQARVLIPILKPGLSDEEYDGQLKNFVQKVEGIFHDEQGQWGQLAQTMKPPET